MYAHIVCRQNLRKRRTGDCMSVRGYNHLKVTVCASYACRVSTVDIFFFQFEFPT